MRANGAVTGCLALLMLGLAGMLVGCTETIYPVTTGYHVPVAPNTVQAVRRVVVWSNNPAVESAIVGVVGKLGHTVVERARLEEVFYARWRTTVWIDEAEILATAKKLGSDRVIFADVTIKPAGIDQVGYFPTDEGARHDGPIFSRLSKADPAFHVSVTVRSYDGATGKLRWRGSAAYPRPITSPENALLYLTQFAIAHAKCVIAPGFEWKESDGAEGGCILKISDRPDNVASRR
ncbi:MAG: hypothetical protein HY205_03035 [Nitrospirae bacterium]|nr:hypothetical protein [Nitrospirota bacterium]